MSTKVRFTSGDLEGLPDRLDDTRYELIDGELYVSRQPHWNHQRLGFVLGFELEVWDRRTGLGTVNLAPGVIFSDAEDVAPDLIWISHRRLAQGAQSDGKLYTAPELAVEILSPGTANVRRDRELKLKLYSRQGVEEYWLVDWRTRTVHVYRQRGGQLELAATLGDGDELASPWLPGFSYPISSLWRSLLD
jgi:Uma2 family endonuclease